MADVSVEFGAKDTGLEQTLKTVQAQLTSLEEEVKSGTLSFDELQQTMRKISQAEKVQDQLQAMATGVDAAGSAASVATPKVDAIGNEMKKTGNEAKDVGDKSQGGFLKMATAVAAGQAAVNIATAAMKAAFNLVKGSIDEFGAALDLGGRLDDLSIQTGIAAGELLVLERAFQNSGAGADKVSTTISKVASAIVDASTGTGAASAAFDRLGLSASELINLPADKQFEKISAALSGVANQTERSALANDIFGQRLAKDLLPLISDFGGEINKAGGQLGSLPGIMNTASASFAAIGDNIKVVQGKFTEFASGILAAMTPALEAITEGLSRIDAAGFGKKLADAFVGGTTAMKGFQAAVDAFKAGNIEGALSLLWESVKLQAMQTADAIYKNLSAAFTTAGQILGEVFRGDGPAMMVIKSAFDFIASYIKEKVAGALSEMFASMGPAFASISESLKQHAEAGATSAELALQRIPIAAELAAEDIGTVLGNAPEKFKENLNAAGSLFPGLEAQAAALAAKQEEVAAAAAKHAPAIDAATNSTQKLLEKEQEKLAAELASSKAKADAAEKTFAQIEGEIELNAAIASGNEKEIERVKEKQRQAELSRKIKDIEASLPAIIEDIIAKTGTSEEEARRLAEQLVAGRIAAAGVAANAGEIKTPLEGANEAAKTVKQTMTDIENAKLEAAPQRLKERTADARTELKSMADFIGQDLSQMPLDNILTKLGLDPSDFATTDQKLTALEGSLKKIGSADPADITPDVDLVGVNDRLEKVKEYLSGTEKKKPDVTPTINQEAVKQSAESAKETIESQRPEIVAEVNQAALDNAVAQMQAEITNEFTGGEGGEGGDGQGGQGGTGGEGGDANADMTSLINLLQPWEMIISAIRDRLPITALA
jgi:hypothetical protein